MNSEGEEGPFIVLKSNLKVFFGGCSFLSNIASVFLIESMNSFFGSTNTALSLRSICAKAFEAITSNTKQTNRSDSVLCIRLSFRVEEYVGNKLRYCKN